MVTPARHRVTAGRSGGTAYDISGLFLCLRLLHASSCRQPDPQATLKAPVIPHPHSRMQSSSCIQACAPLFLLPTKSGHCMYHMK